MYWTEDRTQDLLHKALKYSEADQTEAAFAAKDFALTRFAANAIHQNMSEQDAVLTVRVARGKKLGSYATNQLDDDGIKTAVREAAKLADMNEPTDIFNGFTPKMDLGTIREPVYIAKTEQAGAAERADLAYRLIHKTDESGFEAAGSISNSTLASGVATSNGQTTYQLETRCYGLTVINRPGQAGFGTGYAEHFGRDIDKLDPEGLAETGCRISRMNHDAKPIEPGKYTCVMSPASVALLLYYLGWMGLQGRAVLSKQSFLAGHWGEQVLNPMVTIYDDALDGRNYGMPFDWEGYPRERVNIVTNGIANDVVWDSFTAAKGGRKSTGHALTPMRDRYYSSPMAEHLILEKGDKTVDEMIANTEYGLYINHMWYVREVNFADCTVTGMTRDGTFLIENGKITRAVNNLRFGQSLVKAFNNVSMIGNKQELSEVSMGAMLCPAVTFNDFSIDAASSF